MKKADVLQLSIVIVGIILGFHTLQYLFSSLYPIFAWLFSGGYGGEYLTSALGIFALIGLQFLVCWLLITRSGSLATYFYRKSELGSGFKVMTKPNDLLYILLISIGIYLLLSNLTPLLTTFVERFISRSPRGVRGLFEDERPVDWAKLLLDILLPLILLMFGRPIADYFAKNIGEEPVSIEETINEPEPKEE
jgi:hypothetical protein